MELVGLQPIIESLGFLSIRARAVYLEDSLSLAIEGVLKQAVTGVGRRIVAALSIVIWQSEVEARRGVVTITLTSMFLDLPKENFVVQSSSIGLQIINASFDGGAHRAGEGIRPVHLGTNFFDDSMGGEMLENTSCTVVLGQKANSNVGQGRSTMYSYLAYHPA